MNVITVDPFVENVNYPEILSLSRIYCEHLCSTSSQETHCGPGSDIIVSRNSLTVTLEPSLKIRFRLSSFTLNVCLSPTAAGSFMMSLR